MTAPATAANRTDGAQRSAQTTATCEVFVMGAGPAGATIAALLAERGRDVVVVDKEHHPRFHIGESLLPLNVELFEKLGIKERVDEIGLNKYGVEFNSPQHRAPVMLDFGDAYDKSYTYSYHVRRSEFDKVLFDNCVEKGARAFEGCKVVGVEMHKDDVAIRTREDDGTEREWTAKFLVDATGRDTFLANKLGIKQRNRRHNSAALYGHFINAKRLPGREEGNISIFWFDHGWFWYIPLKDGTTSVGAVCWPYYMKSRKSDPTTFLRETIALCPALTERLKDATLITEATATGNYSYMSTRMFGDRYIMLGDAFAFVDPVFSAGVFLAMNSAFRGADVVEAYLTNPRSVREPLRVFDRSVRHGVRNFSWFIYRMTSPAIRELFMHPRNVLGMQESLLGLLAGDLFRGNKIYWGLRAFKGIYYITNLVFLRRSFAAWRRRRRILREVYSEPAASSHS